MARTTLSLYDGIYDGDAYHIEDGVWRGSANRAVYTDNTTGDSLILQGKNLKYDHGTLVGGKVDKIVIAGDEGQKYYAVDDFTFNARMFSGDDFLANMQRLAGKVFSLDLRIVCTRQDDDMQGQGGNDLLLGRAGDDALGGGEGRDMLTGGSGADIFIFRTGWGPDTISDFDADGGDNLQDLLDVPFDDIQSIARSGKNTVIDFGQIGRAHV